jgi:hypothetical protein
MSRRKLTDLSRLPVGSDWTLGVSIARHGGTTRSRVVLEAYPVSGDQKRQLSLFHADLRTPPPTDIPHALTLLGQAVNGAVVFVALGDL